MLAAVDIDRLAVDVLHCDVRTAVLIDPGVVEARDVRMLEQRTDVAFTRHALAEASGPRQPRQLQRNLPLEGAIGALGQPYAAHAAAADLVQQPIRTDALAGSGNRFIGAEIRERGQQARAAAMVRLTQHASQTSREQWPGVRPVHRAKPRAVRALTPAPRPADG